MIRSPPLPPSMLCMFGDWVITEILSPHTPIKTNFEVPPPPHGHLLTFHLGNLIVLVFTPGSVLPLQLDFVPEQEIQVCELHLALSTGSQTPGWDFAEPVGAGPPTLHVQPGSPRDKGVSQSVSYTAYTVPVSTRKAHSLDLKKVANFALSGNLTQTEERCTLNVYTTFRATFSP